MPIQVVCPGCKKRFAVSEKFAGKKGPCPNCKAEIEVPEKAPEVVIHAPEYGPKDAQGRAVLKPISRTETRTKPVAIVLIVAAVLAVIGIAVALRFQFNGEVPMPILATGAVLLGPVLALAGYSFLRDDELEPYRGRSLWVRVLICGLVYAILWAVYAYLPVLMLQTPVSELNVFNLLWLVPPIAGLGGLAALASLDLDYGTALLHYGLYLVVTVALCFIMNVPLFQLAS